MTGSYELLAAWLRARFAGSDRGSSVVEYALLVCLIALTCIVVLTSLGRDVQSRFDDTGSAFPG